MTAPDAPLHPLSEALLADIPEGLRTRPGHLTPQSALRSRLVAIEAAVLADALPSVERLAGSNFPEGSLLAMEIALRKKLEIDLAAERALWSVRARARYCPLCRPEPLAEDTP